jgi:hypothetical protein
MNKADDPIQLVLDFSDDVEERLAIGEDEDDRPQP